MEQKETQRSAFGVGRAPDEVAAADCDRAPSGSKVVSVLLPYAVEGAYSYLVRPGTNPVAGSIVAVPLATRTVIGAVWDRPHDGTIEPSRLRQFDSVLPTRPLSASLRAFVDWVADYTLSPPGMVLRKQISPA